MGGKQISVTKYRDGKCWLEDDLVAEEITIRIFTNKVPFGTLVCSPWNLEELVIGYLCIEGVIHSYKDILNVEIINDSVNVTYKVELPEATAKEKTVPPVLRSSDVVNLIQELDQRSEIFRQTGGVHNAAVSDGKVIITNTEDVSRHNALDRLVGRCLMQGISLQNKVIVFSGRVPEEIISGVAYLKCSAIISVSAPTSKAIEIAEKNNVMLICFARGNRFNVYTCSERLINE